MLLPRVIPRPWDAAPEVTPPRHAGPAVPTGVGTPGWGGPGRRDRGGAEWGGNVGRIGPSLARLGCIKPVVGRIGAEWVDEVGQIGLWWGAVGHKGAQPSAVSNLFPQDMTTEK